MMIFCIVVTILADRRGIGLQRELGGVLLPGLMTDIAITVRVGICLNSYLPGLFGPQKLLHGTGRESGRQQD